MASSNISTKLNPVQLYLLELFSKNMGEDDLSEIKKLLVQFYQQKVEKEVDAFWESNNFTTESWNKATRDLHLRRKKKSNK